MHYEMTTMVNGMRVITETMSSVRSVSVGCWVATGTRDERPSEAGASHFLEHLLFKGTDELSAREISETLDRVGAISNAFTSKEDTCYWARMLDEHLPAVLSVLAGMLRQPAFRHEDIVSERSVVFEEINSTEDDHHRAASELFSKTLFEGHPLERPVLGTRQSVEDATRGDLFSYWQRRYTPAFGGRCRVRSGGTRRGPGLGRTVFRGMVRRRSTPLLEVAHPERRRESTGTGHRTGTHVLRRRRAGPHRRATTGSEGTPAYIGRGDVLSVVHLRAGGTRDWRTTFTVSNIPAQTQDSGPSEWEPPPKTPTKCWRSSTNKSALSPNTASQNQNWTK